MRADSLLTELAAIIGAPDVKFAEAPQRLTGGFFTENHRFRLAHAPPPWDTPLVLRLFPVVVPDDVVRLEAVVQGGVAAAGLPAPSCLRLRAARRSPLLRDGVHARAAVSW